jgi:hypothetical protein
VQLPAPSQTSPSQGLPLLGQVVPLGWFAMVQLVPLQMEVSWQLVGVQVKAVPPHVPAVQTSFDVQRLPSSQVVPSATLDQVVVEVAGVHARQAFAGFTVPAGKRMPPMKQSVPHVPLEHTSPAPQLVPSGSLV